MWNNWTNCFFTTFYLLIQGINLVPGGRELQTTTIREGGRGGGWKVLIFDVINGDKGRKSEKSKIGAQFDYLEFSQPTRIRKG